MFLQLVTPPPGPPGPILSAQAQANVDSLFLYTPLQLSAMVETIWRNRYNAAAAAFVPWPQALTDAVLNADGGNAVSGFTFPAASPITQSALMPAGETFTPPLQQPGLAPPGPRPSNWDHLIYAYLIENTRIFDIFSKVLEAYLYSEQLETPSPASQQFWRNTEYLLYGDGIPSMVWTTQSRLRRDELANRMTVYYWLFGIDLSHAQELAAEHRYRKPAAANRDFIPTFESFAGEVWRGIMNAKNFSGANATDPVAISTAARRIYDMMATRRLNGNLAREEFRAVAVMSWLHLAVMYDSPAVVDLKATASSPEQRLAKIAERVGMQAHSKAKPLFDLAQPFSFLMQSIETGAFSDPAGASLLYQLNTVPELNAEVVIDQYSQATGRDLKAASVAVTTRAVAPTVAPALAAPRPAVATNGRARPPRTRCDTERTGGTGMLVGTLEGSWPGSGQPESDSPFLLSPRAEPRRAVGEERLEAGPGEPGGPFLPRPGDQPAVASGTEEALPAAAEVAEAWAVPPDEADATPGPPAPGGWDQLDPYAGIRPGLTPESADQTAEALRERFGGQPAAVALHQLLVAPGLPQAALAMLQTAGQASVRVLGQDVSVPAYLRLLARLTREAAEYAEAQPGQAPAATPALAGGLSVGPTTEAELSAAWLASPDAVPGVQDALALADQVGPVGPGPAPPAAPRVVRQDGIDVYQENSLPSWAQVRSAGITFLIHKATEQSRAGTAVRDREFPTRYRETRANGFVRGSFHYYRHADGTTGEAQADLVVAAVKRLGPGDLPPALDFEGDAVAAGQPEPTIAAWRTELEAFLDTLETKLGRAPLVYTSAVAWHDHLSGRPRYAPADFAHFSIYPLWIKIPYSPRFVDVRDPEQPANVVHVDLDNEPNPTTQAFILAATTAGETRYATRQTAGPLARHIPDPWQAQTWFLWQYSNFTPSSMRNVHGFRDFKIDFNVTQGGIHVLRGVADLGHTAPHTVGNLNAIAYAEPDGRIHLLEFVGGAWRDQDVFAAVPGANTIGALPPAAGDPAAVGVGSEQVIVYRSADGGVHALTRMVAGGDDSWRAVDITAGGSRAFDDPFVLLFQGNVHGVYWDELGAQVHVSRVNGVWRAESFVDPPAGSPTPSQVAGSAVAYADGNALRVVCRSRAAGHLFEFVAPAGGAAAQDLTAASRDAGGATPPAATYRPTVYSVGDNRVRIVFRGVGGAIWQIERDTLAATDLTRAAGAPRAAGSPSAVFAERAHILYRGIDGTVSELFDDGPAWRTRPVCTDAASDPTAAVDALGQVTATFRTVSGGVRVASLANGAWRCEDARLG